MSKPVDTPTAMSGWNGTNILYFYAARKSNPVD